jgi:transposase-like protein
MSNTIFATLFGWWPNFRDAIEGDIVAEAKALAPEAKVALVSAAQAGASAALSTEGDVQAKASAALAAATPVLEAASVTIGTTVLKAAIQGEISNPATTPAPTEAAAS